VSLRGLDADHLDFRVAFGSSITYRIAVGPRAGQKLFTLQTVPVRDEAGDQQGEHRGVASAGGFSLHAGIGIAPGQRHSLAQA